MAKRQGFTLIEVVLALAITSTTLVALFTLQATLFRSTFSSYNRIIRLYWIKNLFVENMQNPLKAGEKRESAVRRPAINLTIDARSIPQESDASSYSRDLLVTALGSWQYFGRTTKEKLVSFFYVPPEPPKKESKTA